jgi:tRNA G37 N-methylase TrmD
MKFDVISIMVEMIEAAKNQSIWTDGIHSISIKCQITDATQS